MGLISCCKLLPVLVFGTTCDWVVQASRDPHCVALLVAEVQIVTELLTLNVVSRWRTLAASADSAASILHMLRPPP